VNAAFIAARRRSNPGDHDAIKAFIRNCGWLVEKYFPRLPNRRTTEPIGRTVMPWKAASHVVFALAMIAIGIIGLMSGSFAPIWQPVPDTVPDRQVLADLCTFISLACGGGLLIKRVAAPAGLVLLVYLSVWTILFKVPFIIHAPLVEGSYQSCGENAVLIAGAWVLYVLIAKDRKRWSLGPLTSEVGLQAAYKLYGLALIAFGFSHFVYLNLTTPLVPSWLPAPMFWAYFTGGLYLATGISLVTGIQARLGAAVAALEITLITLLVWGPMVLAGQLSAMHWQETVVSLALTAAAWVVATSFDGRAKADQAADWQVTGLSASV
jgi:uncharacterized membrane protein